MEWRMIIVERTLFHQLKSHLPAITKDCLRETYGISESTWRRLRDGRPIRLSTYGRLMKSFERRRQEVHACGYQAASVAALARVQPRAAGHYSDCDPRR